ncbi:T9SS type A sorting domain-containing protein [Flavobacterium paronense]|uniref:T9SS type A sorting domain-containing protein n=1 Tax=Flavobacterium paronense TaxID=1392775 RepID=A0ABV5GDK0_9FLAO|nr:T9SS type A sorting domain-containing protein [Flavobacterium paronense]MDN3677996.1 T9SS type A sorting domain-containing protein [Flavobacterium paronense]
MKTTLYFFCFLFSVNLALAQLNITGTSFVYNKGSLVFVTNEVNIKDATSNFYLRNEGQLLQGSTVLNGLNKGVGKLSVFQEGTTNNFAYNYWCSPTGNASAGVGNENFGITMLNVPTTNTASTAAINSGSYNGFSSAGFLSIADFWIFRFLAQPGYAGWTHSFSTSNIAAGQGFTMKGTTGTDATDVGEAALNNPGSKQRYDFRGKPNDGDIDITVANGNWTLTGNPYPSAIDLSAFLIDAANCTGIAYFWEQDKSVNSHLLLSYRGGYGTFSPVLRGGSGIYVPATFYSYDITGVLLPLTSSSPMNSYARTFAPIGQGFMIEGNALGTTVTMKNAYRVFQKENAINSVFEKNGQTSHTNSGNFLPPIQSVSGFDYTTVSTDEVPQIRFNTMLNNEAIKQVVLAFDSAATDGVDHAKDAKNPDDSSLDMNFLLNDKEYVISVIQFDENKRIPVSFKCATNAVFKITVVDIRNFDQANAVYLFDSETGLYHDIKNSEYEFSLPTGTYNSRFQITFKNDALSVSGNTVSTVMVVQNNANDLLTVLNPNLIDINTVTLFDITGKLLFNKEKVGTNSSYQYSTASFSDGVYLVKIQSIDGQSKTHKIIVSSN